MALNLDLLAKAYFYWDEPVDYKLKDGKFLKIYPVQLPQSEAFLSACDVLAIDKNSTSDVRVIQMSYLEFIITASKADVQIAAKLNLLLAMCLHIEKPLVGTDEKGRYVIFDKANSLVIHAKQFEDIRRIIMYQNILHYDDSYVDADLKKAMQETDELKNKNIVIPSVERKMAIITSHCGLSKLDQQKMTYRAHCVLFEEVCGEVEFTTVRPIALYGGQKIDHWIYKEKKGRFDGYIMEAGTYTGKFGADYNSIPENYTDANSNAMESLYSQFNK